MNTNTELFKRAYLSLALAADNTLLPNISYRNFIHFQYTKENKDVSEHYSAIFVDIKENKNKYLLLPQEAIIIEYREHSTNVITNDLFYLKTDIQQIVDDFFNNLDETYFNFLQRAIPLIQERELTFGDFSLLLDKIDDFYIIGKQQLESHQNSGISDNYHYCISGTFPFFIPVFDLGTQEYAEIILDKSYFGDVWNIYDKNSCISLYQDIFGEDVINYFAYSFTFRDFDTSFAHLLNTKGDESLDDLIIFSKERANKLANQLNILIDNEQN